MIFLFLANSAINVITFLVGASLKVVALDFFRIASTTRGRGATVRASLEKRIKSRLSELPTSFSTFQFKFSSLEIVE